MWLLFHALFLICFVLMALIFFVYPVSVKVLSYGKTLKRRKDTPPLTVIIPTYNEEALIRGKIENLLECDYPREKVRILVVDNGSTDRTLEIARTLPVEVFTSSRGKVTAINKGLQEAGTKCIVVTDADVTLERSALRSAVSLIGDEVGAVSGTPAMRHALSGRERKRQRHIDREFGLRHKESLVHSACSLDGRLMVFSADIVPQFPSETLADDYELTFLTLRKGKRAVVDLEARITEERPGTFVQETQRVRRWFAQGFLTSWRYRDFLWNRKYSYFGCWTFPFRRFFIYYIPFYFLVSFLYVSMIIKAWILFPVSALIAYLIATRNDYPVALFIGIVCSWYDLLRSWKKKHAYLMGTWDR